MWGFVSHFEDFYDKNYVRQPEISSTKLISTVENELSLVVTYTLAMCKGER